jgi:dipeptidyl aminopeptidase/acylaminoacyl peptidase
MIVFEHNFEIWKLETAGNQAVRVNISRRGAPAGPSIDHITMTDNIDELALSPDGKKVAFIIRGEVFAASAKDGGDATPITRTPETESNIAWAPDSRRLVYMSDRGRSGHLYLYDFGSETETQLTQVDAVDHSPKFSPDGKLIAFVRGGDELRAVEVQSKQERLLARGGFDRPPFSQIPPFTWSPDSHWVGFLNTGDRLFRNVNVVLADGTGVQPISFLANAYSNTVSWSPDGKSVYFDTGQRTETRQIARIDLVPRTPQFREDQFRDLFKEESPRSTRLATPQPADQIPEFGAELAKAAANKGAEVVFDDIRKRISMIPTGVDSGYQRISPDGKSLPDRRTLERTCGRTPAHSNARLQKRCSVHARRQRSLLSRIRPDLDRQCRFTSSEAAWSHG